MHAAAHLRQPPAPEIHEMKSEGSVTHRYITNRRVPLLNTGKHACTPHRIREDICLLWAMLPGAAAIPVPVKTVYILHMGSHLGNAQRLVYVYKFGGKLAGGFCVLFLVEVIHYPLLYRFAWH